MPKKAETKNEVELDTNTLSDAERESLDVKNHDSSIRLQTKGVYFGLIIFGVLAAAGLLFLIIANLNDTAFTIDGKKFTKSDVKKVQDEAAKDKVNAQEALDTMIDTEKRRAAAAKVGAEPSEQQLESAIASKYPHQVDASQASAWRRVAAYGQAQETALAQAKEGYYDGDAFYFYFSRLQEALTGMASLEQPPENYRDAAAIAKDREYAQDKVQYYYDQIKNKSMTGEKVTAEILKDAKLAPRFSSNRSGHFRVNDQGEQSLTNSLTESTKLVWREDVLAMTSPGLTEIKLGQVTLFDKPNNPQVDGYFYFVNLKLIVKAQPDIEQQYNAALSAVKVVK